MAARSALVIDEWALARWGLASELGRHGFAPVDTAGSATAAVGFLRDTASTPTLAIVGSITDQAVTTITRTLVVDHGCGVIALLPARDMGRVLSVLQAGASAVLERDGPVVDLRDPIRAVLEGRRHVSAPVLDAIAGSPFSWRDTGSVRVRLTGRELDVLRGLVSGRTNAEIGARLSISEETVKTHVTRIFQKLGVRRRSEAVALALRLNLV